MKATLRSWFASPVFADDREKTRLAGLLNTVNLAIILFTILIMLSTLVGGRMPASSMIIDFLILAASLLARYWLYHDRIRWSGNTTLIYSFVLTTAVVASVGTIRTPSITVYMFLVTLAGLLYEERGIILASLLSSLAVFGLFLAERAGILPPADYTVTVTQWAMYAAAFCFTGALVYYAIVNMQRSMVNTEKEMDERVHAEEALRKLTRAVEQSPTSIVITNLEGQIEYVNPRFTQVTGYTFEEAVGQNPRILKTDLTRPGVHQQLWDALRSGKEWHGEFVNRKKDGSLYTESAIISPITDLNGAITHYVAVKEDITERKRIDQALRISELRFRSLFEQTHDAVFILDLEGNHLAANQRAADMLGYRREDIVFLSVRDISAEAGPSMDVIERLVAGEHVPLYEWNFRKKNGEILPVEINVELVRDGSGRPMHIQSVVRDISQRKLVEESLHQANEELNQRIAEIERLEAELREQALRDPLTGLHNRRYLSETMPREIARAEREHEPVSVIVSDIDNFKVINDTYGHQAGDSFLVEIAALMKNSTRGSDVVCRYGGEEFLLVFPGASLACAAQRAEEIRQKIDETVVMHEGQALHTTISLGVAAYPDHGTLPEQIIIKADKALYMSKQSGRNRVTVWKESL